MTGRGDEDERLQEVFKRAAAVASTVPTALQEAAFNRAVDALLTPPTDRGEGRERRMDAGSSKSRRSGSGTNAHRPEAGEDPVATLLAMPRSSAEEVDDQEGALGKSLALLTVAEREVQVPGLTAPQIAQVLTTKFKWKVSRQAITQALDRAGKMVDSVNGPGARVYTIMGAGLTYLQTPPEERQVPSSQSSARRRGRSTRPAGGRPVKPSQDDGQQTAGVTRKNSRRSGPTEALEKLIADEYFTAPRTLGAIREKLRDTRGLIYRSSDLSPVLVRLLRDGKLSRERNADSQYEYVSK